MPADYALAVDDEFAMGEARRTARSGAVCLLSLVAASQCLRSGGAVAGARSRHVSTWAGRWLFRGVLQRYAASGGASLAACVAVEVVVTDSGGWPSAEPQSRA